MLILELFGVVGAVPPYTALPLKKYSYYSLSVV